MDCMHRFPCKISVGNNHGTYMHAAVDVITVKTTDSCLNISLNCVTSCRPLFPIFICGG